MTEPTNTALVHSRRRRTVSRLSPSSSSRYSNRCSSTESRHQTSKSFTWPPPGRGVDRLRACRQLPGRAGRLAEGIAGEPRFNRRFHWMGKERLGAGQLPTPLQFVGEQLATPTRAPAAGGHTDAVLADLLGWDDDRIAESRAGGTWGHRTFVAEDELTLVDVRGPGLVTVEAYRRGPPWTVPAAGTGSPTGWSSTRSDSGWRRWKHRRSPFRSSTRSGTSSE